AVTNQDLMTGMGSLRFIGARMAYQDMHNLVTKVRGEADAIAVTTTGDQESGGQSGQTGSVPVFGVDGVVYMLGGLDKASYDLAGKALTSHDGYLTVAAGYDSKRGR